MQGQSALAAACAAAQSREAEVAALKQLGANREKVVQDQAAAIAQLERKVAESDALVGALKQREAALTQAVQELQQGVTARGLELQAATAAQETLKTQLDASLAALEQERTLLARVKQQHEAASRDWAEQWRKAEREWRTKAEGEVAAALAEAREMAGNGAESAREWAEQLARERQEWARERAHLVKACQERLDDAERWLEVAARDNAAQRENGAAAAAEAAAQMQRLESYVIVLFCITIFAPVLRTDKFIFEFNGSCSEWAQRLKHAVAATRGEERERARAAERDAAANAGSLAEKCISDQVELLQAVVAEDFEHLRAQVERCLEALAERVLRQQAKAEKRHGE